MQSKCIFAFKFLDCLLLIWNYVTFPGHLLSGHSRSFSNQWTSEIISWSQRWKYMGTTQSHRVFWQQTKLNLFNLQLNTLFRNQMADKIVTAILLLSPALNPIFYFVISSEYRQGMISAMKSICSGKSSHQVNIKCDIF